MELGLINKKDFIRQMKIDRHTFQIWIEKGLPIIRIGYKTYLKRTRLRIGSMVSEPMNHQRSLNLFWIWNRHSLPPIGFILFLKFFHVNMVGKMEETTTWVF